MLVKITFQFVNPEVTDRDLADRIMAELIATGHPIEEFERTDMTIILPEHIRSMSELRRHIRNLINQEENIAWADVWYLYYGEFVPDRFVMWSDGRVQEYTGHVTFTEDI